MYLYAKEIGITLLTVTHRTTLWKYHTKLLQFDGEGGYEFSDLDAEARLNLHEKKAQLECELAGIDSKRETLRDLCAMLGEDSVHLHSNSEDLELLD